ncbi:MAG: VanW family protein, partial [Chloroflexota bacterium]
WGVSPRMAAWRLAGARALAQPLARGIALEPLRVALVFREIVPPLTEVEGARERVAAILSGPLTLTFSFPELDAQGAVQALPRRWDVDQAVLATWLTVSKRPTADGSELQVDVDRERIRAHLAPLVDEVARPAREGRFGYDPATDTLTVVAPGQYGYALDLDALVAVVAEACITGQRVVTLPVVVLPPRVTRADLEALRPLALVSVGESSFAGSTADRLQNIKVATARFHGVTVPAQATFSFLEHLGLVTQANGYANAWVIYGDRTVLGPGGGVCQVSTTCFRAAFWGGFPIVERRPHAYRVSWYEPPLGLDAAVYSPVADMRFRNDTDSPLLLLTEVDERASKLYFRLYGRPTGRTVRLEGPVSENPVRAPDPVLEEDPTLAAGQRVQVDWPKDGLDVRIYRLIGSKGEPTVRQEFFSRYQAWPARYRVGPSGG